MKLDKITLKPEHSEYLYDDLEDNISEINSTKYGKSKKHSKAKKSILPTAFIWIIIVTIILACSIKAGQMIALSGKKTAPISTKNPTNSTSTLPATSLEIISPANGYDEVSANSYILKIKTDPSATVLINDVDFSKLVKSDGSLEASINLPTAGMNYINITASSPNHTLSKKSISIKRSEQTSQKAENVQTTDNQSSNATLSENDYIKQAWKIPYDQLVKYPRVYQNKIGLFLGQIENLSMQNDTSTFYLKLSSSGKLYIEYQGELTDFKQGDKVKLYGEVAGTKNATPRIIAKYIYKQ